MASAWPDKAATTATNVQAAEAMALGAVQLLHSEGIFLACWPKVWLVGKDPLSLVIFRGFHDLPLLLGGSAGDTSVHVNGSWRVRILAQQRVLIFFVVFFRRRKPENLSEYERANNLPIIGELQE